MFDIDKFVSDCLEVVAGEGRSAGLAAKEIIERSVSDPLQIEATIGSLVDSPVLSIWHNSEDLTVLHMVYPPGADLLAHDHQMWAAIGLYRGREDNRLFRHLPAGHLEQRGDKVLQAGGTILLGDDTVHAVANPSREWTGAIHVYGGDWFTAAKLVWPDPDSPPVPFDSAQVTTALDEAAERAGR